MRKSLRLSSTGLTAFTKDPEPPAVKSFATRFSLTSFAKRVQRLTSEQRSAISRTGFGNLLSIPNHSLNRIFLTELMEAWNSSRRAFAVCSGEISMSLLDVALILGLPVVGNSVELTGEEEFSDWEEVYGAARGKRKVTLASLEARLDSIGEVVSDDFVRSFLLYLIGTFLCSNDGKVDSRYLLFLENLDEVSSFAWGAAVVEDLCLWLDKRKENNVQYVGGCLVFLQTWSYEHFDIARPQLQDDDMTFPRVCRWDHSKSHPRQRGNSRFKDLHDDQVIWKLQPTSGELQIELIKEALEFLGDNKEVDKSESCSTSTSSSVSGVDSELQLSISSKVPTEEEEGEEEAPFENQVFKGTPTRVSIFSEEYREQETNLENLIVEDTPPDLSISCRVHTGQEMNCENLKVVDSHRKLSIANTTSNLSIRYRVRREREMNCENLVVMDTSNSSNADEAGREEELHAEKIMVEDHPINLCVSEEGGREEEYQSEKLVMEEITDLSIGDEVGREEELHAEKLMVEDHSKNLCISEEGGREEECHAEKLITEDITNLRIAGEVVAGEVGREQELNAQNLIVDDTPPKLSFHEDDLTKKNIMLEEENIELKKKIDQLVEEIGLLRRQNVSYTQLDEQHDKLKQELESAREENRILRLSIDSYVDGIERHIMDFETNTTK